MSLKISTVEAVPEATFNTAHAAFPKGNPCITLRDHLGTVFSDEQFADLFPKDGQPALAPWKLALVTVLQFGENLSDRQAAESVRARIDWKYLLGLELTDAGFDFSVLSEFRNRLINGGAEERLLELFVELAKTKGLVKVRGQQRTDATHVLAAVRELNRLELVAESMRAVLNEISTIQPEWLQEIAPADWYKRYSRRVEDNRLPKTSTKREAYATTVGEDGFFLLDHIDKSEFAFELNELPKVKALRIAWSRHYDRSDDEPGGSIIFRSNAKIKESPIKIESPYDTDARYRTKRDMSWTGYMVHLTETCDKETPHLITNIHTTPADVHDVNITPIVQQALKDKDLLPKTHLVDSAYIDASLLVSSKENYDIDLVGPPREYASWQKLEGGYDTDMFTVDWENKQVICPHEKRSTYWKEGKVKGRKNMIDVKFSPNDCRPCKNRHLCTRAKVPRRGLKIHAKEEYEARKAVSARLNTEEGKKLYNNRAGIEGTISEGVRNSGLRQARYKSLSKTHLQQVASAVAMNFDRFVSWMSDIPRKKTRISRFKSVQPDLAAVA